MVSYINRLIDAIRSTGCQKLTYYNVSQDFRVSAAIRQSEVQGSTHAWYPTALNFGHRHEGNGLLLVDRYEQMLNPLLDGKSKLVYEFDSPDMDSGYMFPAMVREFRRGGIQFAAMFSYDMLRTAPLNLGWQTHFLNMVYTPSKAVSAIIAAEVMRRVPRGTHYGYYPENDRFGDDREFRVSFDEQLSELNTDTLFYYSNNTRTAPHNAAAIRHIAGVGSSPVVDYSGTGIYFLDKQVDGSWLLEVYPNIVQIADTFIMPNMHKPVCRSEYKEEQIHLMLPDLNLSLKLLPGTYLFKENKLVSRTDLPQRAFYESNPLLPAYPEIDPAKPWLPLLTGIDDPWQMRYTRTFDSPAVTFRPTSIGLRPAVQLSVKDLAEKPAYQFPCDATFSHYIGDKIAACGDTPSTLLVRAHGINGTDKALCLLVDKFGRGYGTVIPLTPDLSTVTIPFASLKPMRAAMLPQDWPAVNSYWYPNSMQPHNIPLQWQDVEQVQISLRNELYTADKLKDKGIVVERIDCQY
jgi:hypothetical protein